MGARHHGLARRHRHRHTEIVLRGGDLTGSGRSRSRTPRLKVLEAFRKSGISPSGMVLDGAARAATQICVRWCCCGGRFATVDLNDLKHCRRLSSK